MAVEIDERRDHVLPQLSRAHIADENRVRTGGDDGGNFAVEVGQRADQRRCARDQRRPLTIGKPFLPPLGLTKAPRNGLVPSERSIGDTVRRGPITKAGNGRVRHMLVESAWTYRHPPRVGRVKLYKLEQAPPQSPRDSLEGAGSPDFPISGAVRASEETNHRLHGNRARAGRLLVGRRSGGAASQDVAARPPVIARTQAGAEPTAGKLPAKLWAQYRRRPRLDRERPGRTLRHAVANPRIRA